MIGYLDSELLSRQSYFWLCAGLTLALNTSGFFEFLSFLLNILSYIQIW